MKYQLVRIAEGVHSVRSTEHAETFHPVIGPRAEAEALYLKQLRLAERLESAKREFVIWDVGLGAAANVLTVLRALKPIACEQLRVVSFEHTLEPLRFALQHATELNYLAGFESAIEALLREHQVKFMNGAHPVQWELKLGDFPHLLENNAKEKTGLNRLATPDAIIFDPFSPAKNPLMWTARLFTDLFCALDSQRPCALATYSRSTMIRTAMLLGGFFVGAGHATGEKEETTIASNTLELIDEPLAAKWLERARTSPSAEPLTDTYRQAPLSAENWAKLRQHPQFAWFGPR